MSRPVVLMESYSTPDPLLPWAANLFCAAKFFSFDHLVGTAEQRDREHETERFGGFHVDDQFDLCCKLHRQIGRLLALENAAHISANNAIGLVCIRSVAHEP